MTVHSTVDGQPDILLANPLFISKDPVEQKLMTPYFPLGLLYLALVLRQHDYSVAMFDGSSSQTMTALSGRWNATGPRLSA